MNGILKSISVLVITILLQIVVFRFGIFAGGNVIIFFHLYGIVLLPIGWHKTTYLFYGTLSGIIVDLVIIGGGLHMASGAFLGLFLPHISDAIAPRDGFQKGHVICALKDGWIRFLSYCFLVSTVYSFGIFTIEGGRLGLILVSLWKAILSSSLTVLLMGLAQGLFGLKKKNKKSKVSAYPWS